MFNEATVKKYIELALYEDLSSTGDITTNAIISKKSTVEAVILFKSNGILAGSHYALMVFDVLGAMSDLRPVKIIEAKNDGDFINKGEIALKLEGPARLILSGERTFLNILQRMCGIATYTKKMVDLIKGYKAKIVDTRKTTPNFRVFEKAAVRAGGAFNHRFGLFDGILIKDNHIEAAGSITKAIEKARNSAHHLMKIEIETKNLAEVEEALAARADVIMLDNMDAAEMTKAVGIINQRALCEASGGINEETLVKTASCGVDLISIGAITHSARPLDISLNITGVMKNNE